LAEVAHACGFADQGHFIRVFRQRKGGSPGRFRLTAKWTSRQSMATEVQDGAGER
jgi:AraC-like DNA-binding protein